MAEQAGRFFSVMQCIQLILSVWPNYISEAESRSHDSLRGVQVAGHHILIFFLDSLLQKLYALSGSVDIMLDQLWRFKQN